jgi:hypothetical protein
MKYSSQAEKFSAARSDLMLPHAEGEAISISEAFHNCSLALCDLDEKGLNEDMLTHLSTIKNMLPKPDSGETDMSKAEALTFDQKMELSNAVDELAHHFCMIEDDMP